MSEVITQQVLNLQPEYQEKFIKDLLANLYRTEQRQAVDPETGELKFEVDPETGEQVPVMESYAAGLATRSPLYGEPQFDEEGNPIYKRDSEGNLMLDARGQPIQEVIGGVPRPDVMPLTPAQQQAIKLGIEGIGAYAPLMEDAEATYASGIGKLEDTFGRYDPRGQLVYDNEGNVIQDIDPTTGLPVKRRVGGISDFYDPYVEEVIDVTQADIQRAGDISKIGERARAIGSGAFGGSRQAVAESELQRNIEEQKARTGAQLRSQGYQSALKASQTAFENQLARGQSGAQIFQGLGTAQAGLGQLAQSLGYQDVQNLMNVGGVEQQQTQAEYDVQRQSAIERAYEPYTRFGSLANIFATATRGTPASSLTLGAKPEQNVLGSTIGTAMGLGAYQQQYGGGSSVLGGLINR
jgi:hypothetical protein